MNIHKSQLFWGSLGTRVLTHPHLTFVGSTWAHTSSIFGWFTAPGYKIARAQLGQSGYISWTATFVVGQNRWFPRKTAATEKMTSHTLWVVGSGTTRLQPRSVSGVECDLCPAMDTPVEAMSSRNFQRNLCMESVGNWVTRVSLRQHQPIPWAKKGLTVWLTVITTESFPTLRWDNLNWDWLSMATNEVNRLYRPFFEPSPWLDSWTWPLYMGWFPISPKSLVEWFLVWGGTTFITSYVTKVRHGGAAEDCSGFGRFFLFVQQLACKTYDMFLPLEVAQSWWGTPKLWPLGKTMMASRLQGFVLWAETPDIFVEMSWHVLTAGFTSPSRPFPIPFLLVGPGHGRPWIKASRCCVSRPVSCLMWQMQHLFDGERKLVSNSLMFWSHRIHVCYIHGNIYHQYTPFMLAYIPAPWIRHGDGSRVEAGCASCASCAKPIWVVWRSMPQLESWWTGLPGLPRGKRLGAGFDGGWGPSLETWGSKKPSGKCQWLIMVLNGY